MVRLNYLFFNLPMRELCKKIKRGRSFFMVIRNAQTVKIWKVKLIILSNIVETNHIEVYNKYVHRVMIFTDKDFLKDSI